MLSCSEITLPGNFHDYGIVFKPLGRIRLSMETIRKENCLSKMNTVVVYAMPRYNSDTYLKHLVKYKYVGDLLSKAILLFEMAPYAQPYTYKPAIPKFDFTSNVMVVLWRKKMSVHNHSGCPVSIKVEPLTFPSRKPDTAFRRSEKKFDTQVLKGATWEDAKTFCIRNQSSSLFTFKTQMDIIDAVHISILDYLVYPMAIYIGVESKQRVGLRIFIKLLISKTESVLHLRVVQRTICK